MNKQKKTSFKFKDKLSSSKHLQLIHMDLCGPSKIEEPRGEPYFMLVIDDYSRLTWVAFLRNYSEEFEKFKAFKAFTETQTGCKLKRIRLD